MNANCLTDWTRTERNCQTGRTEQNANFMQWVQLPSLHFFILCFSFTCPVSKLRENTDSAIISFSSRPATIHLVTRYITTYWFFLLKFAGVLYIKPGYQKRFVTQDCLGMLKWDFAGWMPVSGVITYAVRQFFSKSRVKVSGTVQFHLTTFFVAFCLLDSSETPPERFKVQTWWHRPSYFNT